MLTVASIPLRPAVRAAAVALAALLLAACAQQRDPGYYAVEHDSTLSDAQDQAQGRSHARAPSQIQLGFGSTAIKPAAANDATNARAATATAVPRALAEAKTFLGTIPCVASAGGCSASRITLTLSPHGEWRSRTMPVDAAAGEVRPLIEQGCWSVIGTSPLRILLLTKNESTKANLTFVTDNLLHINRLNDIKPTLDYSLTRQADIDAIDELSNQAALVCGK